MLCSLRIAPRDLMSAEKRTLSPHYPTNGWRTLLHSVIYELKYRLHRGDCPFCEGPMMWLGMIRFAAVACVRGVPQPKHRTQTFLDEVDSQGCTCPECRPAQTQDQVA